MKILLEIPDEYAELLVTACGYIEQNPGAKSGEKMVAYQNWYTGFLMRDCKNCIVNITEQRAREEAGKQAKDDIVSKVSSF